MDGQCKTADCTRGARSRGLCYRCYKRWQCEVGTGGQCSIGDCDRPAISRGWCRKHYMRWFKRGTTDDPERTTVEALFWSKVDKDGPVPEYRPALGPCWLWTAARLPSGYGRFAAGGYGYAHRYVYALRVGPLLDGLTIDHLCRVRFCVRPDHLDLVTGKVNTLRGESPSAKGARKTECQAGHPFDLLNTYIDKRGRRACRTCRRAHDARRAQTEHRREYARKLAARLWAERRPV